LVELLTEYRRESRQQKNYQFADRIRDDLRGLGVALEDHSQGTSWHFDPALRG